MLINFPGEFTDLNQYLKAMSNNRFGGGKIKKMETERAYYDCRNQLISTIPKSEYPIHIVFNWYCRDKRKDIDNVAFAKKFILDGMVMAGILENDSRKFLTGFSDEFFIDSKNPRVIVEIR